MKILEKIKRVINPNLELDDDFSDDYNVDEEYYDTSDGNNNAGNQINAEYAPYSAYSPYANQNQNYGQEENLTYQQGQDNRAVQPSGKNSPADGSQNYNNYAAVAEIVIVKPAERFQEEAMKIADYLLAGKTVVLNLENTTKETSRRLMDFAAGVAFSINGQVKKISDKNLVIAPYGIAVFFAQTNTVKEERVKSDSILAQRQKV